MLNIYGYFYFIMNPCIYRCIFLFTFYIFIFTRVLCVYILIACSSKNLCGIAQFGCWVCYNMFRREKERVLSCIVARPRWLGTLH
jgi:hypothetical protein